MIFHQPFLALGIEVIFWVVVALIYFAQFIFKKISESQKNKSLEKESENTRRFNDPAPSNQRTYPQTPINSPSRQTNQPTRQRTPEEEELRKFLEALGLPTEDDTAPEPQQTYSAPPVTRAEPTPFSPPQSQTPPPPPVPVWTEPAKKPVPPPVPKPVEVEDYTSDAEMLPDVTSLENKSYFQTKIETAEKSAPALGAKASQFISQNADSHAAYALDAHSQRRAKNISENPLRKLLADPVKLKQAILMREILGTPKGLQS